jgi:hypothetical protein
MKKLASIFVLLLIPILGLTQKSQVKTYTYTELFQLIEKETDSIFELRNARVEFDSIADYRHRDRSFEKYIDRDTIRIDKHIRFEQVVFKSGIFANIHFARSLEFKNAQIPIYHSRIDGDFLIELKPEYLEKIPSKDVRYNWFVTGNRLSGLLNLRITGIPEQMDLFQFRMNGNQMSLKTKPAESKFKRRFVSYDGNLFFRDFGQFEFGNNSIEIKHNIFMIGARRVRSALFVGNQFYGISPVQIGIDALEALTFKENTFESNVFFSIDRIEEDYTFEWPNLSDRLISFQTSQMIFDDSDYNSPEELKAVLSKGLDAHLIRNQMRVEEVNIFNSEMTLLGKFYNHYKSIHNTPWANQVYVEMKDLETKRLAYMYKQEPSFKTFFTWKVNQFLKVFSAYGTEPAKAIIFSLYVILFFALIYLFFPNSWDRHGKNRLVDRYNFFFKYMKRKAGIHEVYLEDHQDEMMTYVQFKDNITNSKHKVPRFFTATALPMYRWAVSGTKLSALILKRIDIMKGTWSELPKSKRFWKSVLLVGAFLIAIIYDIFIKMLNALMLSINTFTTLGFGEIPIKGLPRYLAIIQGFIGWFMLTIFSVSLISQLLN